MSTYDPTDPAPAPRGRSLYTTRTFWTNTLERMVRTAAQTAIGAITVDQLMQDLDAAQILGVTGTATLLALLTALAGKAVGDPESPSFLLQAAPKRTSAPSVP